MEEKHLQRTSSSLPLYRMPAARDWDQVLLEPSRASLEAILADGLAKRRWFGAKARRIESARIVDAFPLTPRARLLLAEIRFAEGPPEIYQIPLALAESVEAARISAAAPAALWASVEFGDRREPALLYDALADDDVCAELLRAIARQTELHGDGGNLGAWRSSSFEHARGDASRTLAPRLSRAEQSNSSVIFGDRLILKIFRRVERGLNPDLELNAHLAKQGFSHVPALAGAIEYRRWGEEPWALGILQEFVRNQGDAWQYTLDRLDSYLTTSAGEPPDRADQGANGLVAASEVAISPVMTFLGDAQRLGRRTAEMHLALAADGDDAAFAPEPLAEENRRRIAERACAMAEETFALLRRQAPHLNEDIRQQADRLLARDRALLAQIRRITELDIAVKRIRCHGDYHLGQVLVADGDFVVIDFEGEPARPLAERREKQLALRDVAGMIRSFHYASRSAAMRAMRGATPEEAARINRWADHWCFSTSAAFLGAYRRAAGDAIFLPRLDSELAQLLDACLVEKAVYELRYELNNRPDWVYLPLAALVNLLGERGSQRG